MGNSEQKISIQSGYVLVERPKDYEVVFSEQPTKLMEILTFCKDSGCRKVLIVGPRTKVSLSALVIYELGEDIAKSGLQIAMVESHDAPTDDEQFLESVTTNRGGSIQFFINEEEAKDWLEIS